MEYIQSLILRQNSLVERCLGLIPCYRFKQYRQQSTLTTRPRELVRGCEKRKIYFYSPTIYQNLRSDSIYLSSIRNFTYRSCFRICSIFGSTKVISFIFITLPFDFCFPIHKIMDYIQSLILRQNSLVQRCLGLIPCQQFKQYRHQITLTTRP